MPASHDPFSDQVIDQFIDVGEASLRVRTAGAGPAVVLVHGWALDLDMWQAQMAALARWYRVIAFDRRGFGRSSGMPGIEHDVSDIERLLERFGISQAAIVGMSQGARVALRWTMRHPGPAVCMVLDGPPREGLPQASGIAQEIPMEHYRDLVRREGIDAFRQRWLQHPFMHLHTSAPGAHRLLQQIAARYPAQDLQTDELSQLSPVNERDLQRLHVPTLIVSGERDSHERRSIAAQLTDALPNVQLKIIPNAGHLSALDNPETYANVLHEFFSSQPAFAAGGALM
jgi:pimeloyl-ACP methyl ester carboxylesterase